MNIYEICFVQEHLTDAVRSRSPEAALSIAMQKLDELAMRPQKGDRFELRLGQKLTIEITRRA